MRRRRIEPDSEVSRAERVAVADVAAFEAGAEPAHALLGRAVRERVRHDAALRLALQRIVADRGRRADRALHVTGLEPAKLLLGAVGPHTGIAVRLQLLSHRQAFGAFHRSAEL